MAGVDPDGAFDGDEFRAQIRQTMLMGLPEDEALRPTFLFPADPKHALADPANRPWDFTKPRTSESEPAADPVRVVCGVTVAAGQRGYTAAGKFEAREAVLSMFEAEWAAVNNPVPFVTVLIGGKPFKRGAELEPAGLFDVTTHRVEVTAEDV